MECKECMRCGRELSSGQVFCQECQEEMEKYPVKPGVVVQLPRRQTYQPKPAPRRRGLTPEEQVKKLKRQVKQLWISLAAALVAAAALGWVLVGDILEKDEVKWLPGQNYSAETTQQTDGAE